MKYLSYEGLQYLYSKILTRLGLKVDATGGDISETVIETVDIVEDKYPVPAAGESVKRFFGKVLTFLRNIRPLTSDISLYVSVSNGSDLTGDGSQERPFKTIQHAIDLVPKDLGRYKAQIIVANGIYPEKLIIENFRNGNFSLLSENGNNLTDNCRIINLRASWNTCYMNIGGFSITTTSDVGIYGYNNTALLLRFIKITENALSIGPDAIYLAECKFSVWNCQVSYHNRVLTAYNSHGVSNNWVAGTGNNFGLYSSYGSRITTTGTQPAATTSLIQDAGGMFTYGNGSQIAGPFGGLSCTWGTIVGGYYRHGMYANGQAVVTMQISVTISSTLSSGVNYTINGLPIPASVVPVNCQVSDHFGYKTIISTGSTGQMVVQPITTIQIGNAYHFNVTYITNS